MQFFDSENIDRQHLRPPVLVILLETIEREARTQSLIQNHVKNKMKQGFFDSNGVENFLQGCK